jgi:hypothetical protein
MEGTGARMTSLRGHNRTEFPQKVRKAAFRRCCQHDGVPKCEAPGCGQMIRAGHLRFEHLQPDGLQGEPTLENCGAWCDVCSTAKDKIDNPQMAKADAVLKSTYGLRPTRQKINSPGFRKSAPQKTASRPLMKLGRQ